MQNIKKIMLTAMLSSAIFFGCNNAADTTHDHNDGTHSHAEGDAAHDHEKDGEHQHVYSCPMHPEVTSEKPGKCPKCGM
ncbi:MAG: heavy metal-binding domain-containing protein, partial [Bacteroidia bacterium]